MLAGINVERAGLLSGTRGEQIAGRFSMVRTGPFSCDQQWATLIAALETNLRLRRHQAASLGELAASRHKRTGGMIGSLLWLIRSAAIQAVIDGTERITKKSMDTIPVDIASQAGRPSGGNCDQARQHSGGPLPVRLRPHQGEIADSYLRRLAAANHLRFSYLRRYLATPRGSYGPIDARGLAVLAGRKPHAILRAFPNSARSATGQDRMPLHEGRNPACLRRKTTQIRGNPPAITVRGMSERAIERKHHAGRRTIIKALDSPDPPARKKIHREPTALNGLHDYINAMIDADPQIATATIWQRLADEHGTIVAYYTLRTYVVSRRATTQTPPPRRAVTRAPDQ